MKDKIKNIIKPHFGYLSLYEKWVKKDGISIEKIGEFHEYNKSHKDIIRKLPKNLNDYDSYYDVIIDIDKVETYIKINRLFKDNLNSNSKKLFVKTYDILKNIYVKLLSNDFKLRMIFRNSSKPKNEYQWVEYIKKIYYYDNNQVNLIEKIENNFDFSVTENGDYLFLLNDTMLDIVPATWCIYNNYSTFNSWKESNDIHSTWVLFSPLNEKEELTMVGIDYKNNGELSLIDSMNNPFNFNNKYFKFTKEEFFELNKIRLKKNDAIENFVYDDFLRMFLDNPETDISPEMKNYIKNRIH